MSPASDRFISDKGVCGTSCRMPRFCRQNIMGNTSAGFLSVDDPGGC